MEKMIEYLNRILPVVGHCLRDKTLAFCNLELTHTVAEAFARCGVKKLIFADSGIVWSGSQMELSYGRRVSSLSVGMALERIFRSHNRFEKEWEFRQVHDLSGLCFENLDLLVGAGNFSECKEIIELAKKKKIPTIVFSSFEGRRANSVLSIVDVKNGLNFSIFEEDKKFESGRVDRLNLLEAADLAANLAKAILLRGTEYERADIEEIVYQQRRNNVIFGRDAWPWWVLFGSIKSRKKMLNLLKRKSNRDDRESGRKKSLMIIGCGTGSLLAGEAINHFQRILLVDCKNFSIYNSVRQLVGTADIGKSKVFVIQRLLSQRLGGKACRKSNKLAKTVWKGNIEVSASELKIEDSDASLEKFRSLLEWFSPDVVEVGMGTPETNYLATGILRKLKIPHLVTACFPLATHYKHIMVDGDNGPCYSCLQGSLPIDLEGGPEITEEQREMFYGFGQYEEKTQPATIIETWPSVHSALRLAIQLASKKRQPWFSRCLKKEENCFVGTVNVVRKDNYFLYGTYLPGQIVTFSSKELFASRGTLKCPDCGQVYWIKKDKIIK